MRAETPLIRRLNRGANEFSRSQRVLAKFVLDHYHTVAFSTVKELAREAGVSEATIVRFAQALDFKGYPEMQREIRRMVRADLKGTERFKLAYNAGPPQNKGPLAAIVDKEIDNIAALRQTLDLAAFRQAALTLRQATEIVVVGTRSTASLAHHFWFGLNKIGLNAARYVAITTEAYDHLARMDAKSCVVVIGFPRYLRELVELLGYAQRRKIRTITITDSLFSALRGDVNLCAPAESASFVAAHCAPLILINGLLHEVSLLDKTRTLHALNRFEALADDQSYFCAP